MQGIVVGINDTAEAREALDWALSEAAARGTQLTVLTVVDSSSPQEADIAERETWASTLVAAAVQRLGLPSAPRVAVATGDAREALLEAAAGADLLVLGRRRLSKLGRLMLGSVSSAVVEQSPVPVTVVRGTASADAATPGRVVVGVDASGSSLRALQHAAEICRRTGATLQAVLAWQVAPALTAGAVGSAPAPGAFEQAARLTLDRALKEAELDLGSDQIVTSVVQRPSASALIEAAAGADRLVVGSRGVGGFDRLLLGSVSRQVVEHAPCPVTVVR